MPTSAFVYILASKPHGVLYIGVTSNPTQRFTQHAAGGSAFTRKYNVERLVHLERHEDLEEARRREWRMKKWRRAWKIRLIEESNPDWRDLRADLANWV